MGDGRLKYGVELYDVEHGLGKHCVWMMFNDACLVNCTISKRLRCRIERAGIGDFSVSDRILLQYTHRSRTLYFEKQFDYCSVQLNRLPLFLFSRDTVSSCIKLCNVLAYSYALVLCKESSRPNL